MNIAGYQLSLSTLFLGALAAVWLLTLLVGIVSWEKGRGRFRKTDLAVLIVTVIVGGAWIFMLLPRDEAAALMTSEAGMVSKPRATCAVIEPGQTEEIVKKKLGDPDEIRGEEELRGPASNVWIYRDSRCAVHFFGNVVE
ncbi:MAG TPA: hypothetical protein VF057_10505, partial [Thermoanaerobaculia bacterium]